MNPTPTNSTAEPSAPSRRAQRALPYGRGLHYAFNALDRWLPAYEVRLRDRGRTKRADVVCYLSRDLLARTLLAAAEGEHAGIFHDDVAALRFLNTYDFGQHSMMIWRRMARVASFSSMPYLAK